jgi:hypothetical protein
MKEENKIDKWDSDNLPFSEGYAIFAAIPK